MTWESILSGRRFRIDQYPGFCIGLTYLPLSQDCRAEMKIVERHLGLVPANEMPSADSNIVRTARIIEAEVDVEAVQALAAPAQPASRWPRR